MSRTEELKKRDGVYAKREVWREVWKTSPGASVSPIIEIGFWTSNLSPGSPRMYRPGNGSQVRVRRRLSHQWRGTR
jgi:hypothetical protein